MNKFFTKTVSLPVIIFIILLFLAVTGKTDEICDGPAAYSPVFSLDNTKSIQIPEMVAVPGGTFLMGDSNNVGPSYEKPVHQVTLSAFEIGKYEVTNSQYAQFIESGGYNNKKYWVVDDGSVSNPDIGWNIKEEQGWKKPLFWDITLKPYWKYDVYSNQENTPVIGISWYEARAYCKWLSVMTKEKYRLPREAEWEYAARGGLQGKKYPSGDEVTHDDANYSGTGGTDVWYYTAPVGSFPPNGYGLCDMAGNIWEWCADWQDNLYYTQSPETNPAGPQFGEQRIVRGGSFNDLNVHNIRCAFRIWDYPDSKTDFSGGFRCVKEVE